MPRERLLAVLAGERVTASTQYQTNSRTSDKVLPSPFPQFAPVQFSLQRKPQDFLFHLRASARLSAGKGFAFFQRKRPDVSCILGISRFSLFSISNMPPRRGFKLPGPGFYYDFAPTALGGGTNQMALLLALRRRDGTLMNLFKGGGVALRRPDGAAARRPYQGK
ncbi:MAG TPA: hypothetical protein VN765_13980 [Candidatus Acidoferrum sp.]|nr:hypothetical protein [Candidatus Acidoferrum sp.]